MGVLFLLQFQSVIELNIEKENNWDKQLGQQESGQINREPGEEGTYLMSIQYLGSLKDNIELSITPTNHSARPDDGVTGIAGHLVGLLLRQGSLYLITGFSHAFAFVYIKPIYRF